MSQRTDHDDSYRIVAVLLAVALVVSLLAFTGCSATDPRTWFHRDQPHELTAETQAQRDARVALTAEAAAGCEAIARSYVPAMFIPEAAHGAGAFVRATVGKVSLPAPAWTVDRIARDPVAYRKAGEAAERSANGTAVWFWLKVVGGCAIPVLLAMAKNLPGLGAVFAPIAEGLWHAYAPTASKAEDEARTTLAAHAGNVVQLAHAILPPSDAARLAGHLTPEVVDALQQLGVVIPAPVALRPTAAG